MKHVSRAGLVLLSGLALVAWDYSSTLERATAQLRQRLLSDEFAVVQDRVERLFTLAYQTNRTISLLPSIRSIQGQNRASDKEDPVALFRFSAEGAQTVQQLYNNLAANVSVSEVYCVLKDFQPQKGEVPFFMYDQLIVSGSKDEDSGAQTHSDAPEEFEGDEYAYLQRQLQTYSQKLSHLEISSLESIPAIASPALRTCDNSQYLSDKTGDIANTLGFVYSVPFYDPQGRFRGVISSIFRTNMLEALLLRIPFIPVTESEQAQCRKEGWSLPEQPGNFVLAVPARNFWVADRRDPDFLREVKAALQANVLPPLWHRAQLKVVDEYPWELIYRPDPGELTQTQKTVMLRAGLELGVLAMMLLGLFIYSRSEVTRLRTLEQLLDAISALKGGDLTLRLEVPPASGTAHDHERRLALVFAELVTDLRGKVSSLNSQSNQTAQIASGLTTLAADLADQAENIKQQAHLASAQSDTAAQGSQKISNMIGQLATELTTLTSAATELNVVARDISTQCQQARTQSAAGETKASRARSDMLELEQAVSQSREAVDSIQSLAHQTNMLALNATIEAASAGSAGVGFAVVAREVKELSRRTQETAVRISELMNRIRERAGFTREAVEGVAGALQANMTFIQHVAGAVEEQSVTVGEVSRSLDLLHNTGDEVSLSARSASLELAGVSRALKQLDDSSQALAAKERALDEDAHDLNTVVEGLANVIRHFKV